MRPFMFLAAIPFALGCAQQSMVRAPALPSDEPLQVRLFQPTGGALNYQLSEPAYVAIFAVTRGHGISMIFPHFQSQVDRRGHTGFNQETVHGGSGGWGYSAGGQYAHRSLFGFADAYYVIASKYPLPVDGILQSPYVLRSLVGADRFRATNLTDTWDALESILVADLPDDTWAADVYLNWRDPFMTASWQQPRLYPNGCGNGFLAMSQFYANSGSCARDRSTYAPPVAPPPPAPQPPQAAPPAEPLDRRPQMPRQPPQVGPENAAPHVARRANESLIDRSRRDAASPRRAEPNRPSVGDRADRADRAESARATEQPAAVYRAPAAPPRATEPRHAPPPPRAAEPRHAPAPVQAPARTESGWAEPHP